MTIRTYHFDSCHSTYQYDPVFTPITYLATNSTGIQSFAFVKTSSVATVKGGHSFFSTFPMTSLQNVTAISLASVELPVNFYNIRSSNASDTMKVTLNSTTFTITVPNINYLTIQSLLDAINANILSVNTTSFTLVFSINPSLPSSIMVTSTNMISYNLTIQNGILSNTILGMALTGDNFTGGIMRFSNSFNLNPDNYLNMTIKNMSIPSNTVSGIPCTFKIPLPSSSSQILYYNNQVFQRRTLLRSTVPDKLTIQITDRWGFPINPNGGDYSFSLTVEF